MATGLTEEQAIEIMNKGKIVVDEPFPKDPRVWKVVYRYKGQRLPLIKKWEQAGTIPVAYQADILRFFRDGEAMRVPEFVITTDDERLKRKPKKESFDTQDHLYTFDLTEEGKYATVERAQGFSKFPNYHDLQGELMKGLALVHGNGYHHDAGILDLFIWKKLNDGQGLQYLVDTSNLYEGEPTRDDFLPASLDEIDRIAGNFLTRKIHFCAVAFYGKNSEEKRSMVEIYNNNLEEVLARKPVARE